MSDDKKPLTDEELRQYEIGRKTGETGGLSSIFNSESEDAQRREGVKDKIDADTKREEDKEAADEEKENEDD